MPGAILPNQPMQPGLPNYLQQPGQPLRQTLSSMGSLLPMPPVSVLTVSLWNGSVEPDLSRVSYFGSGCDPRDLLDLHPTLKSTSCILLCLEPSLGFSEP